MSNTIVIDGNYNMQEVYDANWNRFVTLLKQLPSEYSIKLKKEESPTVIALDELGNSNLWWIILKYNNLSPQPTLKASTSLNIFRLKDLNNLWKSILTDTKTLEVTRSL